MIAAWVARSRMLPVAIMAFAGAVTMIPGATLYRALAGAIQIARLNDGGDVALAAGTLNYACQGESTYHDRPLARIVQGPGRQGDVAAVVQTRDLNRPGQRSVKSGPRYHGYRTGEGHDRHGGAAGTSHPGCDHAYQQSAQKSRDLRRETCFQAEVTRTVARHAACRRPPNVAPRGVVEGGEAARRNPGEEHVGGEVSGPRVARRVGQAKFQGRLDADGDSEAARQEDACRQSEPGQTHRKAVVDQVE